jgi:hypothetical protein
MSTRYCLALGAMATTIASQEARRRQGKPVNLDKRRPSRCRHGFPGGLLGAGAPELAAPPPPAARVHLPLPPLSVLCVGLRDLLDLEDDQALL